ncbi:MAG: sulfotransferase family 2 domain-containing protein [Planctomycetaceae bacterium]
MISNFSGHSALMFAVEGNQRPNICFVHIEKAGGTTFNDFLLENLPGYWILPPQKNAYGWRYEADYLARLRKVIPFQHIGGHQLAAFDHYDNLFPNPLYVSFVREPVSRFLSHVNWKSKQHESTLSDFLQDPKTLNSQCFRISGQRKFEPTRGLIESRPYFIGLAEQFTLSLYMLQKLLGMHHRPFENSNVTSSQKKVYTASHLDSSQLDELRAANQEDVRLYEWIVNEFFPRQVEQLQPTESDLQQFLEESKKYRRQAWFAPRKKLRAAICRIATRLIRP